eukprot:Anaeramoba_ignava/a611850_31.p1 GENE.a611850_31~~a611850_31.p1  ORF type:complete len:278 (-),score=113.27 a611850_31:317-1150(-)
MKNKDKLFDSDTTSESETSESESTSNSDSESDSDSQKNAKTSGNSKKENKEELSYAFEKGKLTIISQDLEEIPITIIRQFALKTTELNLSHNELNKLDGLEQFTSLKSLVLDNNQISSNTSFPKIRSLETFWINRNQIDNLEKFISAMKISYPNLTYLSMLGNPACPNFFTGKDYDDYKRYRLFVISELPKLSYLDSTKVTKEEKQKALKVGKFMKVVTAELTEEERNQIQNQMSKKETKVVEFNPKKKKSTKFGYSHYTYAGHRSEGNRFIRNKDL